MFRESENIELKSIVVENIKKVIIAFANTNGGRLLVGVNGDGSIKEIDNPDKAVLQISNMVRDSIKLDISMFINYETLNIDNKKIVSVNVQKGTERPYYIAIKGLRL